VGPGELAMVPGRPAQLDELDGHALGGLPVHHRAHLGRQLLDRRLAARRCIAREDLVTDRPHRLQLAVDDDLALEHHAAQLLILLAGLDLQRRPRIPLEVAHLLRGGVCPRPQARARIARRRRAQHVPQRHQVRPAARARRRARHGSLFCQERCGLAVAHPDQLAAAHARLASIFGSPTKHVIIVARPGTRRAGEPPLPEWETFPPNARSIPSMRISIRRVTGGPRLPAHRRWTPLGRALEAAGDHWTLAIVTALADGRMRLAHLKAALPGASAGLLDRYVRQMVALQLISRTRIRERPPRVEVELTNAGRELVPIA